MLRAATLSMAVCWPFFMFEAITRSLPSGTFTEHWFPMVSAAIFAGANLLMFVAWVSGRRNLMVLSLRITALTLPIVMVLVFFRPYEGTPATGPGMWFAGFSGIPAVAMALTSPVRVAVPYWFLGVGGTSLMNSLYEGRFAPLSVIGEVGFNLINVFALVLAASGTITASRVIDTTEAKAMRDEVRAAKLRARSDEIARFTGLVHDNILTLLAGIAKGIRPTNPIDLKFSEAYGATGDVTVDNCLTALQRSLDTHTPDCQVNTTLDFTDSELEQSGIPGPVVTAVVMALAEAAKNSAKHAGDTASRHCSVEIAPGRLLITYRDDGPGFDTTTIRPDAAGIKASVISRMKSAGGTGTVTSERGLGTTVTLAWTGAAIVTIPEPVAGPTGTTDLEVFDLLRMDLVYSRGFALAVAIVFGIMTISNNRPFAPGAVISYALMLAIVAVVFPGREHPLPRRRAITAFVLLVALAQAGMWQDLSDSAIWSHHWHLNALSMLGSLVAFKGRPWVAVAGVGTGALVVEVSAVWWPSPNDNISGVQIILSCILVAAAVLVNVGVRYFIRRLPAAQASLRQAQRDAATAAEVEARRQLNLRRLENEVLPVFDAVTRQECIDDALGERARLTEMRLRDAIRSPLLDSPDIRTAVWRARARGISVQLLDDHSESTGLQLSSTSSFLPDNDRISQPLKLEILRSLNSARGGKVTVRLLPHGRSAFATISDADGVRRLSADGAPVG